MDRLRDALDYLYSFVSYEQKTGWSYSNKTLNLERFRGFLDGLGAPQLQLKIIHAAGSDGKGSTCAMIASLLRAKGYRVGLYTSPHLSHIRERIQIDGRCIPPQAFVKWTRILKQHVEQSGHEPSGYATFFELITAMAFLHFVEKRVDWAVIETGLGGRLDATNVASPRVTPITRISMEHAHLLGDTLEKIADEKLGIIRPGAPVIIGPQDDGLIPHFQKRLATHPAPVVYTDRDYRIEADRRGRLYRAIETVRLSDERRDSFSIPFFGRYQTRNALTALATLHALEATGDVPSYTKQELKQGFRSAVWSGRFEIIRRDGAPTLVYDVAHTAKGAAALRESLDEVFPNKKRIYVFGVLCDKDPEGMIAGLMRREDRVVFTKAPTPRGLPVSELQAHVEALGDAAPQECVYEATPKRALNRAMKSASKNDVIIIAGSLYLVGELRSTRAGSLFSA